MEIGLIGLGRMGANMTERLLSRGHGVVGYDLNERNVERVVEKGARGAGSLEELVEMLEPPRNVWVMVPHGDPTSQTIRHLLGLLEPEDLLVDGGNTHFPDSLRHAEAASDAGILFLDAGVSGGVWGLEVGYNLMVGGPVRAYRRLLPVFRDLAPENGVARVGESGAGHFVKMVHNAVEYAMLEALGEGFECLSASDFELDLEQIAKLWQRGSVIRSWLLELLGGALEKEGSGLGRIRGYVDDSGTGRWTVDYALEKGIPVPAISTALFERFDSRMDERFSREIIAALRNQFGGHPVKEEDRHG